MLGESISHRRVFDAIGKSSRQALSALTGSLLSFGVYDSCGNLFASKPGAMFQK
jgi:hypothetical protein